MLDSSARPREISLADESGFREDEQLQEAEPYVRANELLKQLREERMQRDQLRCSQSEPECLDLGRGRQLRLCSTPGLFLGAQLWVSGGVLARSIACGCFPAISGARCIELGAGLGAVGLAAALHGGADSVVLTDKAEMLPLLERNINLNGLSSSCRAAELSWGASPTNHLGHFDVVLAADVVYPTKDPSVQEALKATISALCPPGSTTVLLLAYCARTDDDRRFLHEELLPLFSYTVTEGLSPVKSSRIPSPCEIYYCRRLPVRA